jgi:opacity protein-like surface antigen
LATTAITSVLSIPCTAAAQDLAVAVDPSPAAADPALQVRLKQLEAENRALRKKQSTALRSDDLTELTTTPASRSAYAMAPLSPVGFRWLDWSGPYAGISVGVGWLNANTSGSNSDSDTDNEFPGFFDTDLTRSALSGSSSPQTGGVADLYVEYNFQLSNTWVAGVQVEGSLGRFYTRFNQSGISGFTETRSDVGVNNISSSNFTENDSLNINFMVSALARVGYLVTPRDLIYGLAGWTFAGFTTNLPSEDPSFGANGVTVGAGWERRILDSWTLKLEYRYTKFQTINLTQSDTGVQTNFNGGFATSSSVFTDVSTASISPSLHVLRVGLTHYFGEGWNAPTLPVVKGPVVAPLYAWTGFYTGLSVGVGAMQTNALTGFGSSEISTDAVQGVFDESFGNGSTAGGASQFKPGGVADLFLGYNQQINYWVAGVQIEGSVARFNERLYRTSSSASFSYSKQSFNSPLVLNNTDFSSSTADDTLSMNWMVSTLGRFGYLVDARDMLYGVAGWSFASFSTSLESDGDQTRTFIANGPTVGAGWERQFADLWSFRAEYRYTRFLDRTLVTQNISSTNSANLFGGGTESFASTNQSVTRVSSDMHVFRFGVARAISLY